jgi:hypothetical protein
MSLPSFVAVCLRSLLLMSFLSTLSASLARVYCICSGFLCVELFISQGFVCLAPSLQAREPLFVGCPPLLLNACAASLRNWRPSDSSASAMLQ